MHIYFEAKFQAPRSTLIFGSSLGADSRMWAPQVEVFSEQWNTVTVDMRGHGRTPISGDRPSIEMLADDIVAVADRLGVEDFAFCGLSIGGVIGQCLAARHPERVKSLVLAATGLTIMTPVLLQERANRVLAEGMPWISEVSAQRWFTEEFRSKRPDAVEAKMAAMRNLHPRGYADACVALSGFDGQAYAGKIKAPTLVISGAMDIATPPISGRQLAAAIDGAVYAEIPNASHLCNMEQPEIFNQLLQEHLTQTM